MALLEVGGVPVPGPVILHYMISYYMLPQGVPTKSIYRALGLNPPKLPLSRAQWLMRMEGKMLPVVCGQCARTVGAMEGGKLVWNCHKCKSGDPSMWLRVNAISAFMGDWASDSVAALIIDTVNNLRSSLKGNT